MRHSKNLFSHAERRFALIAAVAVITVTAFMLVTGGLFSPSLGSAAARGMVDLPGVTDATPLR